MSYEKITSANDLYENNYKRWKYLIHSYMGGNAYRKGEYLTRYQMETETEYQDRLAVTPLDNHCKGVISIYNSFLFRNPVYREYGSLENDPILEDLLNNADQEGRSFNAFMKDVSTYSSVFGHCWVMITKASSNARTRAEELANGTRPYLSLISPLNMLDWKYDRQDNGTYRLSYVKYIEDYVQDEIVYKEWYDDSIITTISDRGKKEIKDTIVEENGLGMIPCVAVYNQRSPQRGIGVSDIDDIADLQRNIYNEYSEVEQNIRLSGHPSLVKTASTEAGAGAGAIIQMDEGLDPGLRPYLLQPSGASTDSLYSSINAKVDAIDRIAHLGAMRENRASTMSGVSREMEFQQLNAKLAEKGDMLELSEEQIWEYIAIYQSKVWDGKIDYPDNYNIQDKHSDMALMKLATEANPQDPTVRALIDFRIKMLLDDEDEFYYDDIERMKKRAERNAEMEHAPMTPQTFDTHLAEMIRQGYTMEQIAELHPEFLTILTQRLGNETQQSNG